MLTTEDDRDEYTDGVDDLEEAPSRVLFLGFASLAVCGRGGVGGRMEVDGTGASSVSEAVRSMTGSLRLRLGDAVLLLCGSIGGRSG